MVGPITSLWSAYKLSCGRAINYCGLAINNPVFSEVKSEISLFTSFPFKTIPTYCESMFPNHYGKILDFMHVYDDDIWIRDIEWLPEKEAELE